jgi:iron complex outermembrane receptor protein
MAKGSWTNAASAAGLICVAWAAGPGAAPASAQEAPPVAEGGLVDIIVTAQRRAQGVQDVPIAISAFSASDLAARGVNNTLELGQFIPNLVAQNNTGIGSANAYFLRGLGNTETIATFDPPVGTYVDDIYISRQNANNLNLFDVERVEVLRGPQGTLFGRNTTGGAINVIMRQPGDSFGGFAEVGYGAYNRKLLRGSVDVPLAPTFAVKLSGYWQDDDGYTRNSTTGERINDDDGWGVRLGVRGDLASWARWQGSFAHIVADGENILNFTCDPAAPARCNGRFATTGLREDRDGGPSPFAGLNISGRKAGYGLGNTTASNLVTSRLEFDLAPETTLTFITGFIDLTQQFALDFFDGRGGPTLATPVPPVRGFARGGFTILNDGAHTQFTQEIKLNGKVADGLLTYVVGGFYLDEGNRTDFADVFSIFSPAVPNGIGLLLADRTLTNNTDAKAVYAQGDLNLGEFILTAGIRYTDETKTFSIRDNRRSCNDGTVEAGCLTDGNLRSPSGLAIPRSQTAKIWTPRFAASWQPTSDVLLFASATNGFKSGGWNARGTVPGQLLPFGPEKVWSYEAGFKTDWFDRRLRVNLTAFHMDVQDLQTPSALVAPNGTITFLTRNFADYRNRGLEAEITAAPVEGLTLFVNLGYQDDGYKLPANAPATDQFGIQSVAAQAEACRALVAAGLVPGGPGTAPCGAGIVAADGSIATPVRTPDWSLAMGGSYRVGLGGGWSATPSLNASFRSLQEVGTANLTFFTGPSSGTNGSFPANPFGGDPIVGSLSEAAWLVNAGITLASPEDRWALSLTCNNCLDEEFVQSTLAQYTYLNMPRQWLARLTARF